MEDKIKFIPTCFEKQLQNLSKHYKERSNCENILYREIPTKLSAEENFAIFKNLEIYLTKASDIEDIRKKLNINQTTKIFDISKNCDIHNIKISLKIFKLIKYELSFKLVRFFSYSTSNNSFFFLFKLYDENNQTNSLCKGGIIIPRDENKFLLFVKIPKTNKYSYRHFNNENYLDMFVNNYNIISEAVANLVLKKEFDVDISSTIESIEVEKEIYELKENLKNKIESEGEINYDKEQIKNSKNSNTSISSEEELYEDPHSRIKSEIISVSNYDSDYEEEDYDTSKTIYLDEEINLELIDNGLLTFNPNQDNSENYFININHNGKNLTDTHKNINQSDNHDDIFEYDGFNKFIIDEDDPDYKKVRKLTEKDLKDLNLLDQLLQLKNELRMIDKDKIFSENELIRYIYGWKGQVVNIRDNLLELEKWRNNLNLELITQKDFEDHSNAIFSELISIPCQDIFGRPIILIKAKNLSPKKIIIDSFVKYLIFTIESAIKLMPYNIDKIMIVIDIKDSGLDNFSLAHINKIREVTSRYYVERLSNIVIINKGFFFGMMWSFISKFLDEKILGKLIVLDNSNIDWFKRLLGDNSKKILIS